MSRAAMRSTLAAVLMATAFVLPLLPLFGQTSSPTQFRRLFVPEEALPNQIRGLLPMKREEFERRLALTDAQNDAHESKPAARIERAVFRARLKGTELTSGEAELSVVAVTSEPAWLGLQPCAIQLQSAAWQKPAGEQAILGADSTGALKCLVKSSGQLLMEWTKPADTIAPGLTGFDLQLPLAPRRRLEITAPHNVELAIEGGLVVDCKSLASNSADRIWTMDLSAGPLVRLTARAADTKPVAEKPVIVREASHYNLLPAVIDMESGFTLDVLASPLRELNFEVDRGLQITAVRIADQSAPFAVTAGQRESGDLVTVELASELAGADLGVTVEATARWSADRPASLPRIKFAGGMFQEGLLEVQAPPWLRLQARPLKNCVQTDAAPATATRATDRFVFQTFTADATVEIVPNQTLSPLREDSGTQINVEATQVTGVLVAELKASGAGARFAVDAELPRQWIVDAVETQPPEMLADRTLVSRGQGPQRLHVKLAHPLTAQQPLRLVIRGHYRRPPNDQPLAAEFFHLARFVDVHDRRQLVAVRVNDPAAELRLSGNEGAPRLDVEDLTAADLRLFENPPGTLIVEIGSLTHALQASLTATTPRYRADAVVRARIAQGRIEQSVAIHCQPETSNVASIAVRLSPRPGADVTWRLAGEDAREIPAVLEDSAAAGTDVEDAVYRLLLPRPFSTPLDIVGQWSSHQSENDDLALVFLPTATRQTGMIEVEAPDGDIFLRGRDIHRVPNSLTEKDSAAMYGRYLYEPGRRSRVSVEPLPGGTVEQRAWIDSLRLTSHFLPDGSGHHEAELHIHNAGSMGFAMRLPTSATDCRLVIEAEAEEPLDPVGAENIVNLRLPADQRSVTLRVRYASKIPTLGIWPVGNIRAPVPRCDLPVMAQSWRVVLPLGLVPAIQATRADADAPANDDRRTIDNAAADSLQQRFKAVSNVLLGPALATRPMQIHRPTGAAADPSFAGWNEHVLDLPATLEATLPVYRHSVLAAWSYGLALAAGALVYCLAKRGVWLLPVAGLLAAIAVMSQTPAAWLLSGAAAGMVIGHLGFLLRFSRPPEQAPPASRSITTTRQFGIGPAAALAALLIVALAARLAAAPPDDQAAHASERPRVVIPVDHNQQPSGEYVFVDESLYEALHRATNSPRSSAPGSLIAKASYNLPTAAIIRGDAAAIDELHAAFDFHTFESDATVHLPLRRDQTILLEGRARLDGEAANLAWSADGRALLVEVAQTGKHRLELALAAFARQTAEEISLQIDVPQAAIAKVNLSADAAANATVVSNGAAGKLEVRWPVPDVATPHAASLEAEQLLWWKIRPGSVSLEGRFRLNPLGGPVRELVWETDPRLRLLPGRTSGPIGVVNVEEGQEGAVNVIKAELAEPITAPTEIRLAWLWPDASGLGNLVLPRVILKADKLTHNWMAIAADPALEITGIPEAASTPSNAQFMQAWSEVNVTNSRILDTAFDQASRIVVRPAAPLPHAQQSTDWSVSDNLIQANYSARLTGLPPSQYEHRLAVAPQARVSRVSVTQASRSVAVRWNKQSDGLLVVSLLEPPAAEQTLTVSADFAPTPKRADISLPAFALQNVADDSCSLRIYRQSDVQLKLQATTLWQPIEQESLGEYRQGFGRLAAAFRRQPTAGKPPTVSISANQPRLRGRIFTRVDEDDGDWRAEVQLRLTIANGLLDELRLSVPEEWSEPLEVEPAMERRLEASQRESRKQLVLRGRQPFSGRVDITLRGTIHVGAGGLQAPDVFLVGNPALERFILLDRGSVAEQIDWQMTGLLALGASSVADLPPAWGDSGGDLFRVVGQRFDAVAKARPARAASPRITLADIRCTPKPGRRALMTAALTIQPQGARDAVFVLPAGSRLVQALVDDLPAPCVPAGLRSWQIPALSESLPYRLTIIYDTFLPSQTASRSSVTLAAPTLTGMEVDQSLWTIEDPPADSPARAFEFTVHKPARQAELSAVEIVRLETLAQTLDTIVSAQSADLPRRILAESFLRWKRDLSAVHHRLGDLHEPKPLPPEIAARMQSALDTASKAEQRLLTVGILSDSEVGETMRPFESPSSTATTHFLAKGSPGVLEMSRDTSREEIFSLRFAIAAALAGATVLLALALHFANRADALTARPQLTLAMLGIAWWLLAPFGWLGWVAILAAMSRVIRSLWLRLGYEAGSSIVRWSGSQSR